jgi:CHASE2 domain-containing sensor protein
VHGLRAVSRRRALGMLAVAASATAGGLAVRASGGLRWLEHRSVDARFSLRGQHEAPPGVVVVGIDNDTLANLPRFPFSRTFYARALERLHAAGARVVVFDIAFDRPTSTGADLALFEAARQAAPVIFATSLINSSGDTEVFGGNGNLASIGAKAAATDLLPDGDGVIRHLLDQVHGLPSIAAAAADTVLGSTFAGHRTRRGDFRFCRFSTATSTPAPCAARWC